MENLLQSDKAPLCMAEEKDTSQMSTDSELIDLYSTRILALAAELPRASRLDAPDGTATARAPLCGSTVTVDIATAGGRITDYAANVKACALGQAAASVVARTIKDTTIDEVVAARDALRSMLQHNGAAPAAPFEELEVLRAAQPFSNRHASILLALDAAVEALAPHRATA